MRRRQVLTALAILGALGLLAAACAVARAFLPSPAPAGPPLPPSPAGRQLVGLANPGPDEGAVPLLIELGADGQLGLGRPAQADVVAGNQRWWANQLSDGSLVLIDTDTGMCLDELDGTEGGGLVRRPCDMRTSQRWTHPYLGKDPHGRDHWQLRNSADQRCVTVDSPEERPDDPAARVRMIGCGQAGEWRQLFAFWSAY